MKITNKILILLMAVLLPMGFAGCSDDDEKTNPGGPEETPDFVLEQESIIVKVGAENKATVAIKDGGGEYDAFCLDGNLAKVEIVNGAVVVEGLVNGQTSLIISDKYSRYRRLPVSIYTIASIELSEKSADLVTKLGGSATIKANVVEGNGGYTVESDNKAVAVSITEDGEISMTATSKKADYTATVTVTDCSGFSASMTVSVKSSLIPFTNDELEAIKASNSRRYFYNGSNTYASYYTPLNKTLDDGKQRYGWDYYGYYWVYVDFAGGKSVGVKTDAQFTYHTWSDETVAPVTLEIIKNDGTNIWGTFFYVNDDEEKMYTGYFCDTI